MENQYKPNLKDLIDLVEKEFPTVRPVEPVNRWSIDEINQIINVGRALWQSLSTELREKYHNEIGSYEFCEEVLEMLDLPISEDHIQAQIVYDIILGRDPSELFR